MIETNQVSEIFILKSYAFIESIRVIFPAACGAKDWKNPLSDTPSACGVVVHSKRGLK